MPISVDASGPCFALHTPHTSYLLGVTPGGHLVHLHYGSRVSDTALGHFVPLGARPYSAESTGCTAPECPDELPFEYGCWGKGDFRTPAVELLPADGDRTLDLRYAGHHLHSGMNADPAQPHLRVREDEADTLEVILRDAQSGVEVSLFYCALRMVDAVVRWAEVRNGGNAPVQVERVMSASLPLWGEALELIHLHGAWARERHVERLPLGHAALSFGSTRGASGHVHNPFAAVIGRDCTERWGDAYGMSLLYSGSFLIEAEPDHYGAVRLQAGIHPQGFCWRLTPGESFCSPQCVLVYSDRGLGGMSRIFHRLYREHLCPPRWQGVSRPVVVNNWEATYFDFDAEKLTGLAGDAAALGIDLLVMDDGWFGERDSDNGGLGDWVVNEHKLGCSLEELAGRVAEHGLAFGLWIEPEMVSEDSALYRSHPDWCLQTGRQKTPSRNQFVLDFSRDEVVQHIGDAISRVLQSAAIHYVKWDMNRNITDAYSLALPPERSGELFHRYILGVYRLAERLTGEFPHILFEGCAGGGGRFDPAQLYYMPHIWASDNMDPIERAKIQYGSSLVYPPAAMAAHVCSSPNHITSRRTPLATRGHCAMMGGEFGYELDLAALGEGERSMIKEQVAVYKEMQHLVHRGEFYRLSDPFRHNFAAWMFVDADRTECAVTLIQLQSEPNGNPRRLRLDGLNPQAAYRDLASGEVCHGDTLMGAGLLIEPATGDFQSRFYRLRAVQERC